MLGNAAGAGITLDIKGETVIYDGLKLRHFGIVENRLLAKRPNVLALAAEAIAKMPEEMRMPFWMAALAESRKPPTIDSAEVLAFLLHTLEGAALMLWLPLCDRYGGKYSLDDIHDWIENVMQSSPEEVTRLRETVARASGITPEGNSSGQSTTAESSVRP